MTTSLNTISRQQCVAARGLLEITAKSLAVKSGVSLGALARFESGKTTPRPVVLAAIQRALEDGGITFDLTQGEGPGVRLKK